MNAYEMGGTVTASLKEFESDLELRQYCQEPGVYMIRSSDRLLYVGLSSRSMTERITAHYSGRSNPYLYRRLLSAQQYNETIMVDLVACDLEEARIREKALVYQLQPVYNRRL